MKTVKIPIELKKDLDEFGDGRSINRIMEKLLEDVDDSNEPIESLGSININMRDELFNMMCSQKIISNESHATTIYRLLKQYKKKHDIE